MEYNFIRDIIFARVAGTGVHMSEDSGNIISYRKRRIWGIKSLIHNFVAHIYREISNRLPTNFSEFNSTLLDPILLNIGRDFHIHEPFLKERLEELKGSNEAWLALDSEQKAAFKISVFFDALDETREELATNTIQAVSQFFFQDALIPNYKLHDFGFLFRAREYAFVYSHFICNNGYANTVRRISAVLTEEFEDIFIHQRPMEKEHKELDSTKAEIVADLTNILENGSDDEILATITQIQQEQLIDAEESLQYLLSHPNEEIQSRALEVIMSFEGESLD